MDFVTASTGLISPYWMGLPIRYIQSAITGTTAAAPHNAEANNTAFKSFLFIHYPPRTFS